MKRQYFLLISIALTVFSCQKEGGEQPASLPERLIVDTSYGADARHKMDAYLPAGRTGATKSVILIHGGGWTEGSKDDLAPLIAALRLQMPAFAFFTINYRLAANGSHLFPAQETDVNDAIDFIVANKNAFSISEKLVLVGLSAGGHLAALHAYKNDESHHVKAVVDFFGPTELHQLWNQGIVQQLILYNATGKTYDENPAVYNNSSPVNFVTSQSPPTIILQGGQDELVPPAQANLLRDKLNEKGVVNELVFYPNEGHGWTGPNQQDSFDKVKAFIEAHVD